jgi:hypothetical protein
LCGLGTMWKSTFTITIFSVYFMKIFQNYKRANLPEFLQFDNRGICFFWILGLITGKFFPDISKKHSSSIFKCSECPEHDSRASRILKYTAVRPHVSSVILFVNTKKDFYTPRKTNNEKKKTASMV